MQLPFGALYCRSYGIVLQLSQPRRWGCAGPKPPTEISLLILFLQSSCFPVFPHCLGGCGYLFWPLLVVRRICCSSRHTACFVFHATPRHTTHYERFWEYVFCCCMLWPSDCDVDLLLCGCPIVWWPTAAAASNYLPGTCIPSPILLKLTRWCISAHSETTAPLDRRYRNSNLLCLLCSLRFSLCCCYWYYGL